MTTLVFVHGTWGLTHQSFWRPDSLFADAARANGFTVIEDPFRWSGDLAVDSHGPWEVAASALCWYCRAYGLAAPAVISHSHGRQVVLYAAAWGQRFSAVVDVEGPVRSDLAEIGTVASGRIARWTHTWNRGDSIMMAGTLGEDGPATAIAPDTENLEISADYGHSRLFDDLPAWDELGLWGRLMAQG